MSAQQHIPVFKGDSYDFGDQWMKDLSFKSQDLWDFVESSYVEASDDEARITSATSAKQAWSLLKTEYQGSAKVITVKLQSVRRDFETSYMKNNESAQEYLAKISSIVSQMRSYGDSIIDEVIVAKVLRSLAPKFDHVVAAIEELKVLSTFSFDELMGSLQAHEVRINRSFAKEEKVFQTKGESDSSSAYKMQPGRRQRRMEDNVYMAKKKSIDGKAFGFARVFNVNNLKVFETTLNSIIIGTGLPPHACHEAAFTRIASTWGEIIFPEKCNPCRWVCEILGECDEICGSKNKTDNESDNDSCTNHGENVDDGDANEEDDDFQDGDDYSPFINEGGWIREDMTEKSLEDIESSPENNSKFPANSSPLMRKSDNETFDCFVKNNQIEVRGIT
ncbi:hypothetical protein Tco_0364220 [Tanacetum coccineum]